MPRRNFFWFFALLSALGLFSCGLREALKDDWEKVVTEEEKALFLRAQDLLPYGYQFQEPEKYEKFSKSNFLGMREIEYEFQTPDGEENSLYISITVTIEKSKSDITLSHKAEKIGFLAGLKLEGLGAEEIPGFYEYGDFSLFYIIKRGEASIGNFFTTIDGNKLYTIILSGIFFEDAKLWEEAIGKKLKKFSRYSPK